MLFLELLFLLRTVVSKKVNKPFVYFTQVIATWAPHSFTAQGRSRKTCASAYQYQLRCWIAKEILCLSAVLFLNHVVSLPLSLSSWHNLQGGAVITLRRVSWPLLGSCCKFWSPTNSPLTQQRKLGPCYSVRFGGVFLLCLILVFSTTTILLPLTPSCLPSLFPSPPLLFPFLKETV